MAATDNLLTCTRNPHEVTGDLSQGSSRALVWIMALYIVVVVGRIESLAGVLRSVHLAKIVAGIAIFTALRKRASLTSTRVLSLGPARLEFLFMALITVSIVYSSFRSATFGVIQGTVLSVTIATVLIIKTGKCWSDIRTLLLGCVGSAVVLALVAIDTRLNGRAGLTSDYDPNDFAFVLLTLVPVVITFAVISRGVSRLAFAGIAIWSIFTILRTESRGGLLGLSAVTLVLVVLLPRSRRGLLDLRPTLGRTLGRALLIAIVGAILWSALPTPARTRLATITSLSSDYNAKLTDDGRLTIWLRTLPSVLRRPWGFGAGSFPVVNGKYAGGRYRAAHNMFLQALVELGLQGLTLFFAILISTLRMLGRAAETMPPTAADRDELERRAFARALIAGLIGGCVSGFFLSELYSQALWILIALACVVGKPTSALIPMLNDVHRPDRRQGSRRDPRPSPASLSDSS